MARITSAIKVFDGTEDVGSTNAVHKGRGVTKMIEIAAEAVMGYFYTVTSSGTVALKIEPMTWYMDAIGSAIQSSDVSDITISATGSEHAALSLPLTRYMSFKITGTGANDASTKISLWVVIQEVV